MPDSGSVRIACFVLVVASTAACAVQWQIGMMDGAQSLGLLTVDFTNPVNNLTYYLTGDNVAGVAGTVGVAFDTFAFEVVPEPGSLPLLGLGLVGLGIARGGKAASSY